MNYTAKQVELGQSLFNGKWFCGCHGANAEGVGGYDKDGAIPDLRYLPAEAHRIWDAIVLGGMRTMNGLPAFGVKMGFPVGDRAMTKEEADAIHAYVISESKKAYEAQRQRAVHSGAAH